MSFIRIGLLVAMLSVASGTALAVPGDISITLARGTPAEKAAEASLRRLLAEHDVTPWLFTRAIRIESGAIPHSHPVLTLNTRHTDRPDVFLSIFIHEQLHHWAERNPTKLDASVADLRQLLPSIPVGGKDGAGSERSSYEHLIINYLELRGIEAILGKEQATRVTRYLESDHYRLLYKAVQTSRDAIGAIIERNGMMCCAGG